MDLQSLETEKNKTAFELEIWEKINEHVSKTSNRSKIRKLYWATSVAASLLLLIGAYFFFQNDTSLNPNENLAQFEWINLENNSGIKKRIELADNSVIILEPFSSLKYPSEFSGDQRVVFLKGEA
ncbi:MAG: hypothetical protein P1U70_26395, partial [Saprospiraceae bacterium]|nr:hypothetical protein [Saprospiraceae bacterium]